MYGDTRVIRHLATRLREQGEAVRVEADRLSARATSVDWTGVAADAMREVNRRRSHGLRCCAADHETAADALERHAREVDRVKELIADIERRATALVDAACDRLASVKDAVVAGAEDLLPDPVDEALAGFVPPPSGDVAWLDVSLPGLG